MAVIFSLSDAIGLVERTKIAAKCMAVNFSLSKATGLVERKIIGVNNR